MQCRRPWFDSWIRKICWRRDRLPIPVFLGFPCGSAGKESACNVGDLGSIPGLGISPGEGKGLPTPVFWPGEFHGPYCPWGRKESDRTEQLSLLHSLNKLWEHRMAHATTYSLTYSSTHFKWESDTSPHVLQLFSSSMCLLPFPTLQMQRLHKTIFRENLCLHIFWVQVILCPPYKWKA